MEKGPSAVRQNKSDILPLVRHHILIDSVAGLVLAMGLLFVGCSKEVRLRAGAIENRAATPVLEANRVTTLISDSGITRYRITTEQWEVYDKAEPSYWEFPRGIYLEKFNEDLHVEASLKADYAKYLDSNELWQLRGHVHAVNEAGEEFDTPELYWNQRAEKIYSDSSITIARPSSVIQGIGFESDQTMSQYTILRPIGFFPIDEDNHADHPKGVETDDSNKHTELTKS